MNTAVSPGHWEISMPPFRQARRVGPGLRVERVALDDEALRDLDSVGAWHRQQQRPRQI